MPKKAPEKMTEQELSDHIDELDDKARALREEMRSLAALRNDMRVKRRAEAAVARMSDGERRALAQAVQVKGVTPEEAVGDPSGD